MAVDIDALKLRAKTSSPADVTLLQDALDEAVQRIDDYISKSKVTGVPELAQDRAVLRCALTLFWQDKAQNGVLNEQYDLGDGQLTSAPAMISMDPMKMARAALSQWIVGPERGWIA